MGGRSFRAGPNGLVAHIFSGGKEAEVDQLDPYHWKDRELRGLEESIRFTPRLRDTARQRKAAELAMTFDIEEDGPVRRRRAMGFWSRMARLLAEQGAPSDLQSHVHVAAMRARRRVANRFSREWWALHAYALIGYGERMLQPLAAYLVVALVAAFGLIVIGAAEVDGLLTREFGRLYAHLLASPLVLFRVPIPQAVNQPGMWDLVIWTLVGIANAVLLGFALLALRRTVQISRS